MSWSEEKCVWSIDDIYILVYTWYKGSTINHLGGHVEEQFLFIGKPLVSIFSRRASNIKFFSRFISQQRLFIHKFKISTWFPPMIIGPYQSENGSYLGYTGYQWKVWWAQTFQKLDLSLLDTYASKIAKICVL